ncbi:transcription regulators [Striga asiatica]|uniref:Transcription regulators n=1 Tax=Striga asiatica TaxID=4170 RepID=A0A5A7QBR6_STRAF|nr:transcription regulators [Striga asiatica]
MRLMVFLRPSSSSSSSPSEDEEDGSPPNPFSMASIPWNTACGASPSCDGTGGGLRGRAGAAQRRLLRRREYQWLARRLLHWREYHLSLAVVSLGDQHGGGKRQEAVATTAVAAGRARAVGMWRSSSPRGEDEDGDTVVAAMAVSTIDDLVNNWRMREKVGKERRRVLA